MLLREFIVSLYGENIYQYLAVFFDLYPIWLPIILGFLFWEVWVRYVRYEFFTSTPTVLLEIKLPKEITKSPASMELVFNTIYTTSGETTFFDKYWLGKTRAYFSAEIVSFGGEIHFYLWTRVNMRNYVESAIYAQFPDVEITEAEDYARDFIFDPVKNNIWGINYALTNPDPLPIRTYIDYGLDQNPDPEFAIDPITPMLEFFGSLKPGENMWLQFVFRAHKKEKRGSFFSQQTSWSKQIDTIRKNFITNSKGEGRTTLADDEKRILDGLNRAAVKYAFDVGIRGMYVCDTREAYKGGQPGFFRGNIFRSYSAQFGEDLSDTKKTRYYAGYNSFKLNKSTDTDFPWQDFVAIRINRQKQKFLDAYKRRMFFYAPYREKTMILTTEAMASLYHFPGSYAATPGLSRIQSKRGQAPSNLPV